MKLHEYQAKMLFRESGIPVPEGRAIENASEAAIVAREIGGSKWVVKSQIHAGGRGKGNFYSPEGFDPSVLTIDEAGVPHITGDSGTTKLVMEGGVKLADTPEEAAALAGTMLGNLLVTKQTGPSGKTVNRVLIEQGVAIKGEYYLAALLDRETGKIVVMASAEGGMEIEVVAAHSPEKIVKEWYLPGQGLMPYQARRLALRLGLTERAEMGGMVKMVMKVAEAFVRLDASMLEINPLVVTEDHQVIALDAKLSVDDNALYRQKATAAMRDLTEEDPAETRAHDAGISYIKLDGDIGCLVNGAGLAMSTMDIIKLHGGGTHTPANFLDVGGGASKETVQAAFEIILSDPNVKAILVNIFGGIMRCDTIAEGVVAASQAVGLKVPLVVRLEGNMKKEGKAILAGSELNITPADGMTDAAQKVIAAVDA